MAKDSRRSEKEARYCSRRLVRAQHVEKVEEYIKADRPGRREREKERERGDRRWGLEEEEDARREEGRGSRWQDRVYASGLRRGAASQRDFLPIPSRRGPLGLTRAEI